ncbi:hypothetical protein [Pseudonocardia hydrocarbonoxydans]|uniref:Uncharacterized protein n=1 Tax=Pseudonocardia hydrocarbonoxydans TaxID=76726 RepID=A0A4Y3WL21_9PSEU|nr:hypothetical protein [Pseudonocardia hydrocarbonoxydans]GEC18056.1 hypothetical protein PHY01_03390 [Pseudonocardia hydrocarbonoxydans]
MYATLHRSSEPGPAPGADLVLHQIGGPVTLTVHLTPDRPADPSAYEVQQDCGLTEPDAVPTAAQVITFTGPLSEQVVAAAGRAARERIIPAMAAHPGSVRQLALWQPELRRQVVITLATSLRSLEEGGRRVGALPLLPGEDVALLPGPDHVEMFRVRE